MGEKERMMMGLKAGQSKARIYISVSVLLLLLIGSALYFFDHTTGQEKKVMNLKYGTDSKQSLDLYTPNVPSQKKLPVIIYAHGGGWTGGDKSNVSEKPSFFTNRGYVFVSVNYRLSPKVNYEEMANDVSEAVKWVYSNADKYRIDTSRMNLMGHSAGGHLMMLLVTNPKYLSSVGLSPQSIKSIVNLEGPIDLTDFISKMGGYKKVFGNDQKVWAEASPVTYASNRNLPPMFLVARNKQSLDPFMNKTKMAGNTVDYFEAKTTSHSNVTNLLGSNSAPEEAKNMTKAVDNFLKKYNGGGSSS